MIAILSGNSGSGKTTTLLRLLESLSTDVVKCRGILCPSVIEEDRKSGIDLFDVSNRKTTRLAEVNITGETSLATHGWKLDPQTAQLGNEILRRAIPCDLLFVDELGPLEYERGEGLTEGFPAIHSRDYQLALVTIRPSLLGAALSCWPDARVFDVNHADQDGLISKLIDLVDEVMNLPLL